MKEKFMSTPSGCSNGHSHSCKYHTPVYIYDVNPGREKKEKTELAYKQAYQVSKECSQLFALHPTEANQELVDKATHHMTQMAIAYRFTQLQYDASDEGFAELHRLCDSGLKFNDLDVVKTRLQLACWYMTEKEASELRLQEARKNIKKKFYLTPRMKDRELTVVLEHELHTLQERISWKTTTDLRLRENFFASAAETMLSVKAIYEMLEKEMVSFADNHNLCISCKNFSFS